MHGQCLSMPKSHSYHMFCSLFPSLPDKFQPHQVVVLEKTKNILGIW
jgi:hypothetical protein